MELQILCERKEFLIKTKCRNVEKANQFFVDGLNDIKVKGAHYFINLYI